MTKSERFKATPIVIPMIERDGCICLLLRAQTGYRDGYWDFAGSGHIEQGETPQEAVIRECHEEVGVDVSHADISFEHVAYITLSQESYVYFYFKVTNVLHDPKLMEKNKAKAIEWFSLSELPENMIPEHRDVLSQVSYYSER